MKNPDQSPQQKFDDYYAALYGKRWPRLKKALEEGPFDYETISYPDRSAYSLNRASAICARTLGTMPGDSVLDMCAAPGGKTLIIAAALNGHGRLLSNDISPERRRRLKSTIDSVLPPELSQTVAVSAADASLFGLRHPETFDRILADVPCSSEGHLIRRPQSLSEWSPARIRSLGIRQFSILASAADALKIGGELVYSTCSIAPDENDGVIAKLLKKRKNAVEILPLPEPGEKTEFGRLILPDAVPGAGPLYICKIRKIQFSGKQLR